MPNPRPAAARRPEPPRRAFAEPTRILLARGDRVQAIHIRPRTLLIAGAAFVLFSVLYFGSTAYLLLRDDLLRTSGGQQEQLLEGYEDRIAALRTEIDRITSRRAVDHATVAEKVDRLLDMQQTLDERQQLLARLTDAARRAGLDVPPPKPPARPADGPQASAAPVAAPMAVFASAASTTSANADRALAAPALDHVADQIEAMEAEQQQVVDALGERVSSRVDRIAHVLGRLGHKLPKSMPSDVGGPFVPLSSASDPVDRFGADVGSLSDQLDRLAKARTVALTLPLARPVADAFITSGFGSRTDPFLGRPAMHTGVDFRAELGSAARAVAAGTVIAAEWNGGYGNMVDIDHGNGIVTRYGHLSSIGVHVGDHVSAGDKIGRVGSTGRSTGPHLHYEIRIGGEPIDPMRYLNAGDEIAALL